MSVDMNYAAIPAFDMIFFVGVKSTIKKRSLTSCFPFPMSFCVIWVECRIFDKVCWIGMWLRDSAATMSSDRLFRKGKDKSKISHSFQHFIP